MGLFALLWALMGQALMGHPGTLWAGPLWATLGPYGPGSDRPPWALMGRAQAHMFEEFWIH